MLTWVEIKKNAWKHNVAEIRKKIGNKTLLMPVIKSNAYGHGMLEAAKFCDTNKTVDRICVVSLDEALELVKARIKKPILILSIYELNAAKIVDAAKRGVRFPLYTLEQAELLNRVGESIRKKIQVHLKLDSGATRIGLMPEEVLAFVQKMYSSYPWLKIEGIFSHFASSESDKSYSTRQLDIFTSTVSLLEKNGFSIPIHHIACSAAILRHPEAHQHAVRMGINFYGLHSVEGGENSLKLRPALSWHTTIIQVKEVSAGTSVSYGRTFITKRPSKLAILPIGYYDGYDRRFSNTTDVLIKGIRCPVRGRVCMNMTVVDVTEVKNVKAGDKVTLLGGKITADELATKAGTIHYELVTRIPPHIPRVYR